MKTNITTITLLDGSVCYGAFVDLVVIGETCNGNQFDYWFEPEYADLAVLIDGRWAISAGWDNETKTVLYKIVDVPAFESAGIPNRKGGEKSRKLRRRARLLHVRGEDKLPF